MGLFDKLFKRDKIYEKPFGKAHDDLVRIQESLGDEGLRNLSDVDMSFVRTQGKAFPTHWIYKHCTDIKQYAYRSIALRESTVGKYDKVLATSREGLSKFPGDPYLLYMLGRTLCDVGRVNNDREKIETARRMLDDVVAQYPTFPDAYMERGWCKYGLSDYAGAERDIASAIEHETERLSIDGFVRRLNETREKMPQNRCSKCGRELSDAHQIHPSPEKDVLNITEGKPICKPCWDASHHIIDEKDHEREMQFGVAFTQKRFQDALNLMEEIHAGGVKDAFYWYNRGNILSNLRKIDEAIDCYNTAIGMNTHYIKAWYRKGTHLYNKGVNTNSEADLMRAHRCFVNVMRLNDEEWRGAAMFQAFMVGINIHNRCVTMGRKPPEWVTSVIQETHLSLYAALMDSKSNDKDIKAFQADQIALLSVEDEDQLKKNAELAVRVHMVDFCTMHYSKILGDLEPNIAMEIYNPEETEKSRIFYTDKAHRSE